MTSEASMRVVFRHAVELAAMKDDPQEAASQLFRSVGGDRELLVAAHDHYSEILRTTPDDPEARRVLTLVEWALTGAHTKPVVIRAKKASAAG
ncbi:MAG TPA: hypothetical protein VG076_00315 [Acidimicrobiales bacterium]|jgi:hypothetical protein|nr:hypothetical protein [Acidimicrobiales bacterium]